MTRCRRFVQGCALTGALVVSGALVGVPGAGSTVAGASSPTKSVIKIGYAVALTGPEQTVMVPSAAVARAWQSWVNANGGIAGHPVDVIIQDTQGSPTQFLSTVEAFVNTDHVAAVMESDDDGESGAVQFLTQSGVPVIGTASVVPGGWGTAPNFYTSTLQNPATLTAQALAAKTSGASSIGTVVCAEIAACAQEEELMKPASTALGLNFTDQVLAAASAPNYTAQCLTLIQANTQFMSIGLQGSLVPKLIQNCNQQGFKGTYGSNDNGFAQTADSVVSGAKFAGELGSFPWWVNAAPVNQFREEMKKYQPHTDYANGEATGVWSSLQLLKTALGSNPPAQVTASVVNADYGKIKNQSLGGLLPKSITFTSGKPAPNVNCFWLFKYTAGQKNPQVQHSGASGNGQTGQLRSSCMPANGS